MSKHYPGYSTPKIGKQIDLSWQRAFVIWAITLVILVGAAGGLSVLQSSGEAPAYTCAPGSTYTTKECR